MYGWKDKVLRIDLSKNKHKVERLDPKVLKNYIGGRGL